MLRRCDEFRNHVLDQTLEARQSRAYDHFVAELCTSPKVIDPTKSQPDRIKSEPKRQDQV
jgi:hypothetical protein